MITVEFKDDVACGIMKHILRSGQNVKLSCKELNAEVIVNDYELGEETKAENNAYIEEHRLLGLELTLKWYIYLTKHNEDAIRLTIKYYDGEIIVDSIVRRNLETGEPDITILNSDSFYNRIHSIVERALLFSLTALGHLESESVKRINEKHKMTFADGKVIEKEKVRYVYESIPVELLD